MDLEQVRPEEDLTRYILHKNHFSILHKRVKYAAFLPAPNGETSVFRVSGLADIAIWEIGDKEVAGKRETAILGRADIPAFHVLNSTLKIKPDENPPRHANITGWPKEKSEQKLIAIELAENAKLYLR
ncbi:MAG: hypothetical protein C4560_04580 [Nitrospiraceae bacterium]|nr:MAG: hypothetical protein C4560_04580 [Nitrospiraceae bacterium]